MATHNITLTATDKTKGALDRVDKGLDKATRRALIFKGALGIAGAALIALGSLKVFGTVIDDMDKLQKSAQNLNINTDLAFAKFQVHKKMMEEMGISADEFDRAMRNLTTRMVEGLNGNKAYATIMTKLGDSIFDTNGKLKDAPGLFEAVMIAMQNGTIDMTDAQKILGVMVGPKIFNAIKALTDQGISLGDAMTQVSKSMNILSLDDVKRAADFNDAMGRLKDSFTGFLQEAIIPFLPYMKTFVDELVANAPGYLDRFKEAMAKLKPVFDALGILLDTVIIPAWESFKELVGFAADGIIKLHEQNPLLAQIALAVTAVGVAMLLLNPFAAVIVGIVAAWALLKPALTMIDDFVESMGGWSTLLLGMPWETFTKNVSDSIDSIGTTITTFFDTIYTGFIDGFIDGMNKIKEVAIGIKDAIVEVFDEMGKKITAFSENTVGKVVEAWDWLAEVMYKNSIGPDIRDAMIASFAEMDKVIVAGTKKSTESIATDYERLQATMAGSVDKMKDSSGSLADKIKSDFEKMNDYIADFNKSFNDTLVDGLVDGNLSFDTFAGLWKDTLKDLLKDTLNGGNMLSDIMGNIFGKGSGEFGTSFGGFDIGSIFGGFGGIGDALGGIGSSVMDFFGGFFADGGTLGAGKFGIAGERGPEIITGPARIHSNEDSFGGSGDSAPAVNITIQAIDTQTGTEFLLNNKKQIEGIIQNAYNRRGKQGIY